MSELRTELLSQLNTLHRLTQTEEMIARVRRVQAASDAVERELARNAEQCRERSRLLRDLIGEQGGVLDLVGAAVGRLSAAAKAQLEQGTTLPEALLSDLALEHQMLDRARFVKLLALPLNESQVTDVMGRLETAHTATIEWIESILAEVAVGAPTKLRPTPAQVAVATGRRIAFFGARRAASAVNRSVAAFDNVQHRVGQTAEQVQHRVGQKAEEVQHRVGQTAGQVQHRVGQTAGQVQHRVGQTAGQVQHRVGQTAGDALDKLQRLRRDTSEVVVAGRDAALARAEEVAREEGALRAEELPIKEYDALNAGMASARIEKLDDIHDVQVVLTYERTNKNRASVVRAAQSWSEELTQQFIDATS
jgi:hypothetical protein